MKEIIKSINEIKQRLPKESLFMNVNSILFTLISIQRMDCLLKEYHSSILEVYKNNKDIQDPQKLDMMIRETCNYLPFYNTYSLSLYEIADLSENEIPIQLQYYIDGFDKKTRELLTLSGIGNIIAALGHYRVLNPVMKQLCSIDMSAARLSCTQLEEILYPLIVDSGKMASTDNTPFFVTNYSSALLFSDNSNISKDIQIYDPCIRTGAMLCVAKKMASELLGHRNHIDKEVFIYGQNPDKYIMANYQLYMMLSEANGAVFSSNFLEEDKFKSRKFDYIVSAIPWGAGVSPLEIFINGFEANGQNQSNSILHIVEKMSEDSGRAVLWINDKFLSDSGANSNSVSVRKLLLENDLMDSIISMPGKEKSFLLVLAKNKEDYRRNRIQLIDGTELPQYSSIQEGIKTLVDLYHTESETEKVKFIDVNSIPYTIINVEQPLYDSSGKVVRHKGGELKPDPEKRIVVKIPNGADEEEYLQKYIQTHADSNSWYDKFSIRIGNEILFDKYFNIIESGLSLDSISNNILALSDAIENVKVKMEVKNLTNDERELLPTDDTFIPFIPKEWEKIALGAVCSIKNAPKRYTPSFSIDNSLYPVLNLEYVRSGNKRSTSFIPYDEKAPLVNNNDVIITNSGANSGEIHKGREGYLGVSLSMIRLTSSKLDHNFLYFLLKTNEPKLRRMAKGGVQKRINGIDIKQLVLYVPPIEYQNRIVRYLNDRMVELDKVNELAGIQIPIIEEYRNALIYECVTGKKKVY